MDPEKDVLGFIGIGVMGSSMAGHLLKAGYRLRVHTRTKDKARTLIEAGADWDESPERLAPGVARFSPWSVIRPTSKASTSAPKASSRTRCLARSS